MVCLYTQEVWIQSLLVVFLTWYKHDYVGLTYWLLWILEIFTKNLIFKILKNIGNAELRTVLLWSHYLNCHTDFVHWLNWNLYNCFAVTIVDNRVWEWDGLWWASHDVQVLRSSVRFFFPCLKDSIFFTVGFQSTLSVKNSWPLSFRDSCQVMTSRSRCLLLVRP